MVCIIISIINMQICFHVNHFTLLFCFFFFSFEEFVFRFCKFMANGFHWNARKWWMTKDRLKYFIFCWTFGGMSTILMEHCCIILTIWPFLVLFDFIQNCIGCVIEVFYGSGKEIADFMELFFLRDNIY